ncbi:MAG: aminoacetone oxidase family FAD-binding enzyme [Clostridia bacterium]|nr:aminoacetone oxidase family FAD-binding enzyme [Clostridia bacterium]
MYDYDVVVIGGGAAGMACATCLSKNCNVNVALIEAGERLGKKLSVTGNGQGNVSNTHMAAEHYHGSVAALAEKIVCSDKDIYKNLFNCIFTADEKGRVYPSGRQASSLTDSLNYTLKKQGVSISLFTQVIDIRKLNGDFVLELSDSRSVSSRFVVICTGGKAQPVYKGLSPYALAEKTGHRTTGLYPSLVQLKTETTHIKTLKGLRSECLVTAIVDEKKSAVSRGDVIFTEYGVSGNAVFSVSPAFADKPGELSIEFLPDVSAELIKNDIDNKKELGYEQSELLSGTVHNQIGRAIIRRANSLDSDKIVSILKNFKLKVTGTLGFSYAQVTRGGISINEITENLESKIVSNLFFAGEILDIDGDCGGYNLQWAFSSGVYIAKMILKRL